MPYASVFTPELFDGQVIVVTGGRADSAACDIRQEDAVKRTVASIVFLLSPAAAFISGTVLRVDGARPQVRMGWPMVVPDADVQARPAVKAFEGFHRATTPKVFAQ